MKNGYGTMDEKSIWEYLTRQGELTRGEARALASMITAVENPEDVTEWIVITRTKDEEIAVTSSHDSRVLSISLINDAVGCIL
jgi:hypothetical protein